MHRIARVWSTLMRELGYERYAAQGGDWGSAIGTSMAQRQPEPILGLHLTMHFGGVTERPHAGSRASRLLAELAARTGVDTEHHAQLSQFPQTVGYGLTDSPVALAAWLRQRFGVWADCDGDLFATIDRDDLLTNLMLYWVPHAGASSGRIYWESRRVLGAPVRVATGFSLFAKGFPYPSWRSIPDTYQNVVWWRTVARGGHFPAWEQSDAFVTELRGFLAHVARPVRS